MPADAGAPVALLDAAPLLARCCTSHFWLRRPGERPVHVCAPLTAAHVAAHYAGEYAVGLCPIEPGSDTTRVALLDLDSHRGEVPWDAMLAHARALKAALAGRGLHVTGWRSSGGAGIHLYLCWNAPQDARSVRTLLSEVLAETGFAAGTGGIANREIEVFPKQDRVAADGSGSMFILPGTGRSAPLARSWSYSGPVPFRPAPEPRAYEPTESPGAATVAAALAAIPNDATVTYDRWRNYAFAVHYALGDEGLPLFEEWSRRNPKHDPEFLRNNVWPYIRHDRERPITAATILRDARAAGWTGPRIDPAELDDPDPATPTSNPDRFRVHGLSEFLSGRPPGWLVKGVLPDGELAVIYGDSGAGKSFAALDIAAAVARNVPWLGHRVQGGPVVYVAAEGAAGLRNRVQAYCTGRGCDPSDLRLGVIPDAPDLLSTEDVVAVTAAVRRFGNPALVVIDTLAQTIAGHDENSAADMGAYVRHCRAVARTLGALVLLVHHTGKDQSKGARGHSSLRAAADAELEVSRDGARRAMRVTKLKDGVDGTDYEFQLEVVAVGTDSDGDPVTSCVVQWDGSDASGVLSPGHRAGRVRQALIDTVRAFGGEGADREDLDAAVRDATGKRDGWRARRELAGALNAGALVMIGGRFHLPPQGPEADKGVRVGSLT